MVLLSVNDKSLKQKISKRIRALREGTGQTQSDFASKHLIDRQALNRWENGRGVTIYTINRFCKMVDKTLQEFFDDDLFCEK